LKIYDLPEEERDTFLSKIDMTDEEMEEYFRLVNIYCGCITPRQNYDFWSSIFPSDYKDIPYPESTFGDFLSSKGNKCLK